MLWGSATIIEDMADYSQFLASSLDELERISFLTGSRLVQSELLYNELWRTVAEYNRLLTNIKRSSENITHSSTHAVVSSMLYSIQQHLWSVEFAEIDGAYKDPFSVAMCDISKRGYFGNEFCFKFFSSIWVLYYPAERKPDTTDWRPTIEKCVRLFENGDRYTILELFRSRAIAQQRRGLGD
jgi:hypothetical protein